MTKVNPNKETIRRICSLFKCTDCWLHQNQNSSLTLLVDLKFGELSAFKQEIEAWSGHTFKILNMESSSTEVTNIKTHGTRLLPVETETPVKHIEMRRKINHKKTGI